MSEIVSVTELVRGDRNAVLFLCVANSARSQMAEGFARFLGPSTIRIYSAGSEPASLNPLAVRAMNEVGIDISKHRSKGIEEIPLDRVALAITLCGEEACSLPPGELVHLHYPLPDPADASDDDAIHKFREVRDQIRELVSTLF